jgi:tRNA-specific 2-thiouridylase
MDKNRVVVGMSGGVDSSVTAYLLKQQGYDVIGVTMQVWQDDDPERQRLEGGCCSLYAVDDARRVAQMLDIPYYVMNFKDVFRRKVIDYFIDEYTKGRTPNPCLACNRYIKFEELMRRAHAIGAYYIATGHYAKIEYDEHLRRFILKRSIDDKKDQSYVLYTFTQYQLEHTLMPLGSYTKTEVREIARKIGLTVADKPDSQEICFVEDDDYGRFLAEQRPDAAKEGYFVDTAGHVLGKHKGIAFYTIGQRKGLGLSLGKPMYVVDVDAVNNVIVLGEQDDVFDDSLIAGDLNFIPFDRLDKPMEVTAKIRYNAKEVPAIVYPLDDGAKVKVVFDRPQRAVTPGQAVVFYQGDVVVGGGIIERAGQKQFCNDI